MKPSRVDVAGRDKLSQSDLPAVRFMSIGLWPGYGSTKPCIRLQGKWLRNAGFLPKWQVKVTVMQGKLVLEPVPPAEVSLG